MHLTRTLREGAGTTYWANSARANGPLAGADRMLGVECPTLGAAACPVRECSAVVDWPGSLENKVPHLQVAVSEGHTPSILLPW